MKITLNTAGGFAAGIRRPARVVNAESLPESDKQQLKQLVDAVDRAGATVDESSPGRARDAMSYTIAVDDGGQTQQYKQRDGDMSPAFSALLQFINDHT